MFSHLPKLSAPALQAGTIEAPVIGQMGDLGQYCGHWLCAGAGAGKTQGTRLWLEQAKRPYAWIQLDPLDNDPISFLAQLRAALTPLLVAQVQLPEFSPLAGWSLRRHCEYLLEIALAGLRSPSILVIDDAHLIADWPRHPVLHHLLVELEPRLHVVVLSRSELPDAYARQVVNRRIRLLGPEAFVWQASHLGEWLKERWGLPHPDPELVGMLLHLSQGSAAVLGLLDIDALSQSRDAMGTRAAQQLELAGLMEQSLLAKLSPLDLEILRWLAKLGSFPQGWMQRLPFPPVIGECVQRWLAGTSVLARLERTQDELRFHPLFAELLCKGPLHPHPELASLRSQVIHAAVSQGRHIDAIELCHDTQEWERYWELMQQAGMLWIEQGQLGLLSRALASLPANVQDRFEGPTLSLFLAAAAMRKDPGLAFEHADRALQRCSGRIELSHVWATALSLCTHAVIAAGMSLTHFERAIDELDRALDSDWFALIPAPQRLLALGAGLLTTLLGRKKPELARLFSHLEVSLAQCDSVEQKASTVSAMTRVVVLFGISKYSEPVFLLTKKLEELAQSPTAKLSLLHARTNYHLVRGEHAACLRTANAALAMFREDAPPTWKVEVLAAAAFSGANLQDLETLEARAKDLRAIADLSPSPVSAAHLHWGIYACSLAAHRGELVQARTFMEGSVQAADHLGHLLMQVACRGGLVMLETLLGKFDRAHAILEQGSVLLGDAQLPLARRILAGARAFLAAQELDASQAKEIVAEHYRGLEKADDFVQIIGVMPQYLEFLSFGLEQNIERRTLLKVIRRTPLYPKKRPHPQWPSLFEVQTLGRFELRINASCQRSRFLSSGRRFELLTMLLWHGGRALPHALCFEKLWDYIDLPRQARTMRAALRRLLADLGREDAILDEGGTLSLNPELWSFDAWDLHARWSALPPGEKPDLSPLRRGFFGPTPIPARMRDQVPSQGALDLGPVTLLPWLED